MWLTDAAEFVARFDVSGEQAARFQCTAEHLVARRDGGPNSKANVVAACRYCNVQRHDEDLVAFLDHAPYRDRVRRRMAEGTWHPAWAREKGIVEQDANVAREVVAARVVQVGNEP